MQNNYNSLDLIETRFISPENQEFVGELIKNTFFLLMKLAENISTLSKEDRETAISLVKEMENDLSKTCRIFENFKISPSGYTNKIWTYNLIVNLYKEEVYKSTNITNDEIKNIIRLFFEFRSCSTALLQQRNRISHGIKSSNIDCIFLMSCICRMLEINQQLSLLLNEDFEFQEKKSFFNDNLLEVCQIISGKVAQNRVQEIEIPIKDNLDTIFFQLSNKIEKLTEKGETQFTEIIENIEIITDRVLSIDESITGKKNIIMHQVSQKTTNGRTLSRKEAEVELVKLRDKIFHEMVRNMDKFEPYNNILQRPIINALLKERCSNLSSLLEMDEVKKRMGRNPPEYKNRQVDFFGKEIDTILSKIDYSIPISPTGGDDVPF
mgnify:CR=1 FL=1